nr:ribonuclease H-like domain-containing protein [Tanacetum cinerariifolium]
MQMGVSADANGRELKDQVSGIANLALQGSMGWRETKARTLLLQSLPKDHMADFHHLDDAREIWLAMKARFANPDNDDVNMKFLKALPPSWSQVALTLQTRGGLEYLTFDDLYNKLRSLEIDVKGGSSYSSRGTTVAPTHSAFIGAASTNTKMVYSDQPSYSSSVTYTSAHSGSIKEYVLHSFVAENEPTQQLAYKDFKQINFNNKDPARFDRRKTRCYNCLRLGHFPRECNVKKVNEKARYSAFKILENEEGEQVYGLMAGFKSDFVDHAGNAAGSVYDVVAEFAMMGISPKEYIGSDEVFDLSTPSVFDPEPENREVKSLYEKFVKAGEMHEVPPSITGTFMPTSYNSDLKETQVTFGSKSNTSSINTFESNDFVSCDNSDKSSESETHDFTSCVSSPKTNDSFSTVDVKILPKSDVKDLSPTNGFPSCSFTENVKPPRNLYNFPSVVLKATSVPAGSRTSSASTSAGRFIPAASRNRPTSIHASRHIPAGRIKLLIKLVFLRFLSSIALFSFEKTKFRLDKGVFGFWLITIKLSGKAVSELIHGILNLSGTQEQKQNIEDMMLELVKICQEKEFLCIHDDVDDLIESALNSKLLLINSNSQHLDKKEQEVKNVVEQPAKRGNHSIQSLQNFRVVHKKPEHSLRMGYEHLSITPEMESNAENLLPIPSKCKVALEDKRECDVPISKNSLVCDNHSDIFSDSKIDDDISVYDDVFEDIEYFEASLSDHEIVNVEEDNKLLSVTRLISNIESLNDNPTSDRVLNSFESDNSLLDNFSPEFETFCDHSEETRSGNTTHADNSLPEYDSFCFEIEPDQERLINLVKNDIPDNSSNDPFLEEADLFLAADNSIPPGIENFADDPEGDIRFLEELFIDDSILYHELSDFNFEDNPSIPRPPPEPPDTETNAGEEIPVVMNDKDEDVYSSFIFVIFAMMFSLLSAESEDTIFDPGISD